MLAAAWRSSFDEVRDGADELDVARDDALERVEVLLRHQRAGDRAHRRAVQALDRLLEQRAPDAAAAGADHDMVASLGRAVVVAAGDEPGVVDGDAERGLRLERLLQAGEARVGVHEDRVQVRVGELACAVVALGVAADEDVAQAAGLERVVRGAEQRHDLARELRPPEREQLHEHDLRLDVAQRGQDAVQPDVPRALGGVARIGRSEAVPVHPQRRERDDLDVAAAGRSPSAAPRR